MAFLRLALVGVALAWATPLHAAPAPATDWSAYIAEASARFGIPEAWIRRVMAVESGGRTAIDGRPIRSPKGAMGLMQLMPDTWRAMRAACRLGADPDDPHDNILAGTAYLRLMYDKFGYPGLFAAYNAGPGRYADYRAGVATLPRETRRYVAATAVPGAGEPRQRGANGVGLFAVARASDASVAAPPPRADTGLFAIPERR